MYYFTCQSRLFVDECLMNSFSFSVFFPFILFLFFSFCFSASSVRSLFIFSGWVLFSFFFFVSYFHSVFIITLCLLPIPSSLSLSLSSFHSLLFLYVTFFIPSSFSFSMSPFHSLHSLSPWLLFLPSTPSFGQLVCLHPLLLNE